MGRATSLLAETMLLSEVPGVSATEAHRAGRETAVQVAQLPGVTRWGVRVAERLVLGLVMAVPPAQRGTALRRLDRSGLPGVTEYLRLLRGVALMVHHEGPEVAR